MPKPDDEPQMDDNGNGDEAVPTPASLDELSDLTGLNRGIAAAFRDSCDSHKLPFDSQEESETGQVIAEKYKLIEMIGEGGMGTVWYAEQLVPVKRKVALKLIKPGLLSRSVMARFEAERQALALMDHPNIARVLDGGMTESGRPYFVMELVRGTAITTFCDERKLDLQERLRLFIPVCHAIQHAHQKGIIHRDIKPSNVMVALYDEKPVPKVIDFGVAKASDSELMDFSVHTGFGTVVGTAEYMSPEQAQLNNVDIDTRSDVYSLGVLLYELVAGSPPFRRSELVEQGMLEVLRVIREVDPQLPSVKLSSSKMRATIAALRNTEPKSLGKLLRSDLDWIVMKTLEKDRVRRYDSAGGLARDIDRFLSHEPVEACPPSTGYKLRKFLRRNRSSAIAAGLLFVTLLAGIVGTTIGLIRAEWALKVADKSRVAESLRAEGERIAKLEALAQKQIAERAEAATIESYRASTDDAIEQLIGAKSVLGPQERIYLENALARWREFADRQADDERSLVIRGEALFRLALLWEKLGEKAIASTQYEQAAVTWEKLMNDYPSQPRYRHESAHSRRDYGMLLGNLGKDEDAEKQIRLALSIQQKLVAEFPDTAKYRLELAHAHSALGSRLNAKSRYVEAEEHYRVAIAIHEELVVLLPNAPEHLEALAASHHNFAVLLRDVDNSEAEGHFRSALPIFEKLTTDFPMVPKYRLGDALCRNNYGGYLSARGRHTQAEPLIRASLAQMVSLVNDFPSIPNYRERLAVSEFNFGWFLFEKQGKPMEAEEQHRKAFATLESLIAEYPSIRAYRSRLANGYFTLGYVLTQQQRNLPEAEVLFRKAIQLEEALVRDFPSVPEFSVDLGASYGKLADLLVEAGKPADSLDWYDKGIQTILEVYETLSRSDSCNKSVFECYLGRANAKTLLHEVSEADWDKVVEWLPTDPSREYTFIRARTLLRAGRSSAAVREFEAMVSAALPESETEPWTLIEWYDAACFCSMAGRSVAARQDEFAERAVEFLKRAIDAGFQDTAQLKRDPDLDPIRDREDFKKLLESIVNPIPGIAK